MIDRSEKAMTEWQGEKEITVFALAAISPLLCPEVSISNMYLTLLSLRNREEPFPLAERVGRGLCISSRLCKDALRSREHNPFRSSS